MLYAVSERSYFLYHPGLLKSSKTLSMRNEKTDAIILFFIMFFVGGVFYCIGISNCGAAILSVL